MSQRDTHHQRTPVRVCIPLEIKPTAISLRLLLYHCVYCYIIASTALSIYLLPHQYVYRSINTCIVSTLLLLLLLLISFYHVPWYLSTALLIHVLLYQHAYCTAQCYKLACMSEPLRCLPLPVGSSSPEALHPLLPKQSPSTPFFDVDSILTRSD